MRTTSQFLVGVVLLLTAACVPPTAVRDFASSGAKASAQLEPLGPDFYTACLRLFAYREHRYHIATRADTAAFNECHSRKQVADSLAEVTRVLEAYLSALADLAEDHVASYDGGLDSLAKTVGRLPGTTRDTQQVAAVSGVLKFLTSAVVDGYRRRHLTDAIAEQDVNVAALGAVLRRADSAYATALNLEELAMDTYYSDAIRRATGSGDPTPTSILLRETWDSRADELARHRAVVGAYLTAIKAIVDGHHALYRSRHDLKAKQLIKELGQYSQQLGAAARAMITAF